MRADIAVRRLDDALPGAQRRLAAVCTPRRRIRGRRVQRASPPLDASGSPPITASRRSIVHPVIRDVDGRDPQHRRRHHLYERHESCLIRDVFAVPERCRAAASRMPLTTGTGNPIAWDNAIARTPASGCGAPPPSSAILVSELHARVGGAGLGIRRELFLGPFTVCTFVLPIIPRVSTRGEAHDERCRATC